MEIYELIWKKKASVILLPQSEFFLWYGHGSSREMAHITLTDKAINMNDSATDFEKLMFLPPPIWLLTLRFVL